MEILSPAPQHLSSPESTTTTPDNTLDDMAYSDQHQHYLKMEDLHHATTASPAPSSLYDRRQSTLQSSPPPVFVQSKPAKKRKSWGQTLPEPKTNLPPRKRAKTEDEKEQRRIERIKRNRAAAHNSRERKRHETETLAIALARANAELDAYKNLHGPLPSHIVLPDVQLTTEEGAESTQDRAADSGRSTEATTVTTPAPSLVESNGTAHDPLSPASPADHHFQTPHMIKQEPHDSYPINMHLPSAQFGNLDAKSSFMFSSLDPTQHSAAMLCDLQCRSRSKNRTSTSAGTLWSNLIISLVSMHLQQVQRAIMVAIWTLSPSRMARLMQASTMRSTSSTSMPLTTTLRLSGSTLRCLALYNAATGLSAPRKSALSVAKANEVTKIVRTSERRARASNHSDLAAFRGHIGDTQDQEMGRGGGGDVGEPGKSGVERHGDLT